MEKGISCKYKPKESRGGHTFISDFNSKVIARDKKRTSYNDKRAKSSESYDNYSYASNTRALKYMKQTLAELQGEINKNQIVAGDFSTPFWIIDRTFRQKINKEILGLNNPKDQMKLRDIYRTFHTTIAEYTYFNAHRTFSMSYIRAQNKSQNIQGNRNYINYLFLTTIIWNWNQ